MQVKDIAKLYKALSDTTRLKIIKLLEQGELCVCDIIASLQMAQPKVSFHLKVLKSAGITKDRKIGKWVYHSLNSNSDIFVNFLVMSTLNRIDPNEIKDCKARLMQFLKTKSSSFKTATNCKHSQDNVINQGT